MLAENHAALGQMQEALAAGAKAAEFKAVLQAREVSVRYLETMAGIYQAYGSVLEKAGRKLEANKAYSEGTATMEGARGAGLLYHDAMQAYQQLMQAKRRTA